MKGHGQSKIRHPHGIGTKPPDVHNIGSTLKRIWVYLAEEKVKFSFVLIAIVISSALSLLGPYLLGLTVDLVIAEPEGSTLLTMLTYLLLVYVFHSMFLWLQNYWMIDIAQNAVKKMRAHLFSHVQLLPVLFFQKIQLGELMSRLTNDIENVSRTLNTAVVQFVTSLLTITGTVIIMLWLSPLLTILTLTKVPIMYFGMKWITKRTGPYFKKQQRDLGEVNGYVEEMFSGQSIIKLFPEKSR